MKDFPITSVCMVHILRIHDTYYKIYIKYILIKPIKEKVK